MYVLDVLNQVSVRSMPLLIVDIWEEESGWESVTNEKRGLAVLFVALGVWLAPTSGVFSFGVLMVVFLGPLVEAFIVAGFG